MHEIDSSFRIRKEALLAKRRGLRIRRVLIGLAGVAAIGAGTFFYLTADQWSLEGLDEELVQVDPNAVAGEDDVPVFVPAIVDLAGDPMVINLAGADGGAPKLRSAARPADIVEPGVSDRVLILDDTMLSASERFMTTIPSSPEDFAFFQAQRVAATQAPAAPDPPMSDDADRAAEPEATAVPASETGEAVAALALDSAAGWSETIDQGDAALPEFKRTKIANTISLGIVTPETQRYRPTEDIFVRVTAERTLAGLVQESRFSGDDARRAEEALKALFAKERLAAGDVVALRGFRENPDAPFGLVQLSVYAGDTYIGTMARDAAGSFVEGVDPWVRDDLFNYTGEEDRGAAGRQYRLLDAIYSTAARNNVPTGVIGEAIMYLSRGQDLSSFAAQEDRLVLVYSETGRGSEGEAGRVLYAGVRGRDRSIECFVYVQANGEYACVDDNDEVMSLTVVNGMVTPVSGVMTSTFGPRRHPILKTVRVHKGVDWAAPVGTKVFAAFDGEVAFASDGGDYGNLVRLSHGGGRETRYAHLSRFQTGLTVGMSVKAGDLIGFVGTTGLSTGPHLHFELYAAGTAIDPLATVEVAESDGSAVEKLTDRIIHVESGGKATAKNPLSTATGLGQFIESTWVRMMNTYRPDLARSLSRADLLALRFDPTISREMVKNLAREGEAYLKARGHQITAGRLYLCHFLGMEGANLVLSSPGDAQLVAVLGQGVISANPFLSGKDVNYVVDWAERKMNRRAPRAAVQTAAETTVKKVVQASPEFLKYKAAIVAMLGEPQKSSSATSGTPAANQPAASAAQGSDAAATEGAADTPAAEDAADE